MRKHINSETTNYQDELTEVLVLDDKPVVNSFNGITSDAVARAVAGASGEVPQVTDGDNGKVLKAVYDAGGPAVEWGSEATVDQTYDATSENAQSGTAVAGAIAGVKQVPSSTSADADKVLTVNSEGVPGWADAQGGGGGSSVEAGAGLVKSGDTLSVDIGETLMLGTTTLAENNGSVQYFAYSGVYFFGERLMQLAQQPSMSVSGTLPDHANIYILNNTPGSETARGRYTGKTFSVSQSGADFVVDGFPGNLPFEFKVAEVEMELGRISDFYSGLPTPTIYILIGYENNGVIRYFYNMRGKIKSDKKLNVASALPAYNSTYAGNVLQVQANGTLAWVSLS